MTLSHYPFAFSLKSSTLSYKVEIGDLCQSLYDEKMASGALNQVGVRIFYHCEKIEYL